MDLPEDVARHIARSFNNDDQEKVGALLDGITTPRVQRCVLYLANGSLSMLKHYADAARDDIREIVLAAEYETELSETPIMQRDMSQPFDHPDNLGGAGAPRKVSVPKRQVHHADLVGERFKLGEVRYVVIREQPSVSHVYLRRYEELNSKVVKLPLMFVMEQLAEVIDMAS